ncbi:hypothetical protein [Facilibium subflavum]|uniref:hypothetical protein n=1 Tax=Facilibium subflavum TaxID=2219058 RepID=UPI000E65E47C|nr:hypothetical protein [Facilibium subflavum]
MREVAFFEKDRKGLLVNINAHYLSDLGIRDSQELIGKKEVDIKVLEPFHEMHSIGEREARLCRGLSIQKELFYFHDTGIQQIITTRRYFPTGPIEIRGFYFKLKENAITWDGQQLHILNFYKPIQLNLFRFYVLVLKCRGHSNQSVSNIVCRAESTIRNIVQDLYCSFEIFDFVTIARYFELGQWLNDMTISLLEKHYLTSSTLEKSRA